MISRLRPFVLLLLAFALLGAACSKAPGRNDSASTSLSPSGARPTIVFMTDFGTANDAVAICKAVMVGIAPAARIMDITHQVTPFSIEEAARFLEAVSPYYPAGTVFVAVVDPGVGTSRKAIIVKSKKAQFFVLPDNGLITPVMDRDGLDSAREITNPNWMIQSAISSTFHGRDIFSPAAAHLAAGWDYNLVGPEVPQLVRLTRRQTPGRDQQKIGDPPLHEDFHGCPRRRFASVHRFSRPHQHCRQPGQLLKEVQRRASRHYLHSAQRRSSQGKANRSSSLGEPA